LWETNLYSPSAPEPHEVIPAAVSRGHLYLSVPANMSELESHVTLAVFQYIDTNSTVNPTMLYSVTHSITYNTKNLECS
jgi:hypothetical protein